MWQRIDWFSAIFIMMECWHERIWEHKYGPIHSFSFRLKGWDARAWEFPWVNHIALFLREWAAQINGKYPDDLFGSLPFSQITMSHDVDAIKKTVQIKIKQSMFNLFNFVRSLVKGRILDSMIFLKQAFSFIFSHDDWDQFDLLLKIENDADLNTVFNFYSNYKNKSFKNWLLDPDYNLTDTAVQKILEKVRNNGHAIGLHPGYDSWGKNDLFASQKQSLEKTVKETVISCRQHWLRFSWRHTWVIQHTNGIKLDTTLMFNDCPGFRNSAAIVWTPWCTESNTRHQICTVPTILMDSHVYDYEKFTDESRFLEMEKWIAKIRSVNGHAYVLWHPHTLNKTYGWLSGFEDLVSLLKNGENYDAN